MSYDKHERVDVLKAMHRLVLAMNDEEAYMAWVYCIPDGADDAELEDIGVDLRLLERAFSSAHVGLESSFEKLMDTYYSNISDSKAVKRKLTDIKNRGRYT